MDFLQFLTAIDEFFVFNMLPTSMITVYLNCGLTAIDGFLCVQYVPSISDYIILNNFLLRKWKSAPAGLGKGMVKLV